jgi:hypothetical protein
MASLADETKSNFAQLSFDRRSRLKGIADDLLFSDHPGNCRDAAVKLHSLFSSITGMGGVTANPADSIGTILPAGKAISPKDAATCILDFARTSKFLRGTFTALLETQKRFSQRPIEILYAGCGPFAALAIPLTTQFTAADIRFTLLDTHHRSLESAQHLFRALDLDTYVRRYIQSDATSYIHDTNDPLHMVITETMQRALVKEPQVAITLNLVPQLRPGGILIPEKISVDACLFDLKKEFLTPPSSEEAVPSLENLDSHRIRIELGRVFEIGVHNVKHLATMRSKDALSTDARFPGVALDVPREAEKDLHILLRTEITVFGSAMLREYDSGLTHPEILYELGSVENGSRIEFQYILGSNPRFACRWVDRMGRG